MNKDKIIICRCEDFTLADLHDLFNKGYTDIEEIKRISRVGMGACQGNTCMQLIQKELALFLKTKVENIKVQKVRPLTMGVKLKAIAGGHNE